MKVTKIILSKCDSPFKFRFHSSHTIRRQAESIIVILQFNNGISGYGESAPRIYVTGESSATVVQIIQNYFAKILFDTEVNSVEDIENILCTLEEECFHKNIKAYNSALGAIDIALLDAFGKSQEKVFHEFLYPIVKQSISWSLSIPLLPLAKIKDFYYKHKSLEYESVKVLLNEGESDNIKRVHLIRSLFGDHIKIRIEANGKWSRDQAISNIENLKRFNISGVEQPVAAGDIEGLHEIRNKTGTPVIVDESMCNLSDAKKLIEAKACDIINIKISKCGGLLKSKEIRDFAESKNIPCQVGAHVGETDILGKAGRYFAMTTRNLFCFEGFSHLLFEDSSEEHAGRQSSGKDTSLNFGLGVDLAKQRLKLLCSLETDQ
jgi:L-alanine-DL-glutamate epimerase-like enolase superfamily enzyme